jgi:hypothetical protein
MLISPSSIDHILVVHSRPMVRPTVEVLRCWYCDSNADRHIYNKIHNAPLEYTQKMHLFSHWRSQGDMGEMSPDIAQDKIITLQNYSKTF